MTEKKFTAPDAATVKRWREDIVFTEGVRGCEFTFHTTWGIFSPRSIDEGSRLLLDHLEVKPTDDCLDVGCGYGVLGMTLAIEFNTGRVWECGPDGTLRLDLRGLQGPMEAQILGQ